MGTAWEWGYRRSTLVPRSVRVGSFPGQTQSLRTRLWAEKVPTLTASKVQSIGCRLVWFPDSSKGFWVIPCQSTTIIIWMTHNEVSIGLLYSTFSLTAITFCHIFPNPMAVPNCFYKTWRKGPKQKNREKLKYSFFEIAKVKVHAVMMTFDPNCMGYTFYIKRKEILWTTSGASCRS